MSRVGILQSNYIPWRGYFDLIDDCDIFIVYDEVQYTKSDWRNRNKLKTPKGANWITVPVQRTGLSTRIDEALIDWTKDWTQRHIALVSENYRDAPHFSKIAAGFFGHLTRQHERLSQLNFDLTTWLADRLDIKTEFRSSSGLGVPGGKTERLISLVKAVGGTTYLSGPAAESYLDVEAFRRAGLGLEYKTYDYEPYPQLWGPFEGAVSILDLLMNTGPEARRFLKSRSPRLRVV